MLVAGTTLVSNDEKCALLAEVNLRSPDSRGFRRYQILYVVRNDALTECRIDLGPRENFAAPQFRVLGGWGHHIDHTVGELRDIAEFQRTGRIPEPDIAPTDLVGEWHDLVDRRRKARRNQSVFGPRGHHQRSN
jgi:hypothetical protein